MGGPQVNNPQLLAAGLVDFNVGASSFAALNYVRAGVPVVTVAAIFQKDPQVLIAHPGQGNDTFEALKGCDIVGVFWGSWVAKNPQRHQASVAELLKMYEKGQIKPFVSERFPLAKSTLSGHFSVLRHAGLIVQERRRTSIVYSLNLSAVEA